MTFDWAFAWEIMPQLLRALRVTAMATALGMLLASMLGLLWAILRRSKVRAIYWTITYVVEFIRSTPILVQIYFLFYMLPEAGVSLSPMLVGVLALG